MKKIYKSMVLKFLLLVLISISFSNVYSQDADSLYILNPEEFIAEEMFNKRIVMLGEGIGHHNPFTFFCFLNVLDKWIDKAAVEDTGEVNLVIIFEETDSLSKVVKQYIFTGDIKPLLDLVAPTFYFEDLEFFFELKKIKQRLDSINLQRQHKINIDIKGFEEIGYELNEEYYKMNQREQEIWVTNERDKYASEGVINYLNNNPDYNALILYGNWHLIRGYICKRGYRFILTDEECMGYFLAQHLENYFGEHNCITINMRGLGPERFKNSKLEKLAVKSFIINKTFEKWQGLDLSKFDHTLFLQYEDIPFHPLNFVLSRYIIEKSINKMKEFEPFLSGHQTSTVISPPILYLSLMTGKRLYNSDAINAWYLENEFNGFEYLDTEEFKENIFTYYLKTFRGPVDKTLSEIGFISNRTTDSFTSRKWFDENWTLALENIKIINAIGIYWVGYPDEKEVAKEFLKSISGKDFTEPAEYLQWWRREYMKYGI